MKRSPVVCDSSTILRYYGQHIAESKDGYFYANWDKTLFLSKDDVSRIMPGVPGATYYVSRLLNISFDKANEIIKDLQDAKLI
jgi:hypothetical protein